MKKRHPAAVVLLPFVTLGIYCVYWLYNTRKELLARVTEKDSIPPLVVLLLPFLLVVVLLVVGLLTGSQGDDSGVADGPLGVSGVISIALIGIFMVGAVVALPLWWFWKYCKTAAIVTKGYGGMDQTQLYILFVAIVWLCGLLPVWMLITQLDYNKVAAIDTPELAAPTHKKQHVSKPTV
jgi:carbon starvation protein CstA